MVVYADDSAVASKVIKTRDKWAQLHCHIAKAQQENLTELLKKSVKINNTRALYRCVPTISARFWAIFDGLKKTFVHGHREYIKRECASLTKMMTALVVVKLCRRFKLCIKSETVKISGVASNIRGTTANLRKNDILTVEQLLYGTLLPSGNDAAFALASMAFAAHDHACD